MVFKSLPDPNHSMILWFYHSMKIKILSQACYVILILSVISTIFSVISEADVLICIIFFYTYLLILHQLHVLQVTLNQTKSIHDCTIKKCLRCKYEFSWLGGVIMTAYWINHYLLNPSFLKQIKGAQMKLWFPYVKFTAKQQEVLSPGSVEQQENTTIA